MNAMREWSTADGPVGGHVEPGFEAVRDAFAHLIRSGDETGAGLTVIHRGRAVVDLCGGWVDAARAHAWTHDTLVNTFSVTKAFAALARRSSRPVNGAWAALAAATRSPILGAGTPTRI